MRRWAVLTGLPTLVAATAPATRAQSAAVRVGAPAPGAAVETLDGKKFDLASYVGTTPLLLEFWARWCSNCKELEPSLLALHQKYGGRVQFVTVAVAVSQSPERVRAYARTFGYTFPVLYDRWGNAVDAYGVPATSYVVVVARDGRVVYTGSGGAQDLETAIRKAL